MLTKEKISKKWQTKEGKALLSKLTQKFGNYKRIQIIDWNGKIRYFKVSTKRIITKGVKAQDLLEKKYGEELSKQQYEKAN